MDTVSTIPCRHCAVGFSNTRSDRPLVLTRIGISGCTLFNQAPTSTISSRRMVGSPNPQKIISATWDQSYFSNSAFTSSTVGSSRSHRLLCSLNSFKLRRQNVHAQEQRLVILI